MRYIKKPVEIEAIQYFKNGNEFDYIKFCSKLAYCKQGDYHYIETLEGNMVISDGDYIIKGVKGEFYPCKEDIFELTYEKLD